MSDNEPRFHPVLARHLSNYWNGKPTDNSMGQLLNAINQSFHFFDRDRDLLDRAMELSSAELNEAYVKMKEDSQSKFDNIFNISSIGMAIVDLNGTLRDVNNQMSQITGYPKQELVGLKLSKLNHPDDNEKNFLLLTRLIAGELPSYVHEKRYIHKTGRIVPVVVTASLFFDPQTHQKLVLGQVQDVTELIKERELREEQESKYKLLIENALIGVSIFKDDKIIYSNPTLARMMGYQHNEEYLSENSNLVFERATDETKTKIVDRLRAIRANKPIPDSFVGTFVTRQGEERVLEVYTKSITISGDKCRMSLIMDITEKHLADQTLLSERHRFEEIIKATDAGTWEWNIGNGELVLNERWAGIIGYELNELLPASVDTWLERIHPDDLKKSNELLQLHLDKKQDRFQVETRMRHKNGSWIWVLNRGKVAKWTDDGRPLLMYGAKFEITSTVTTRKILEKTNLIFDQAQAIANLGSWRWKIGENEIYWSDSIFKIFRNGEVTNGSPLESYLNLIHTDDRRKIEVELGRAIESASSFEVEHRVSLGKDGIKWLTAKGGVLLDEVGKVEEVFGILRDITAEKLIKEELRANKERYQLLADNGQEIISLLNPDGSYSYCSPAMSHLVGYDPIKLVEQKIKIWDLVHTMDTAKLYDLFQASLQEPEKTFSIRSRFIDWQGNFKWYEKSFKAVRDESGSVVFVRSLKQDISKQLEFEQKLRDTNVALEESLEKLKQASLAKENFLSVMSHEIRTPLNSVIGLSNLLMRRSPRDDQYEIIKTLKNSSDNLMHLVNDILDYNKIQAGKVELESIAFRLRQFLAHLHSSFKTLAEERDLDFKLRADPQIPEILVGDVTRLNQIFTNLIGNAIKFTRRGSVTIDVSLRSRNGNKCKIAFEIKDTGIGIPADKLDFIFQPFQQSDVNVSRQFGGTGLGLSIVKNLVQLFGGELKVKSELSNGSIFTVVIEFEISHYIGDVGSINHKPINLSKLNVLYVEDVESNRFLVQNLLEDNGMECQLATSGEDALMRTLESKFDVILMDIQMPDMDGYQTTDKIRKQVGGRNAQTPIIAFTAEPFSEKLKTKVLGHKIQDVITKPFEIDAFVEKISLISKSKDTGKSSAISMEFYEKAFNGDKEKLRQVKNAIIEDINLFALKFLEADRLKSVKDMRAEIHRIRPIMKNLGAIQLVNLLDQFKLHEKYTDALMKMSAEVLGNAKQVIENISNIDYQAS